ncbi:helix-turn-helix domain-containing protein [Tolypothrix sp. NIES-4075]|jgi:transcriptional regulator with XRE-family HTH domain|uniref:helix-turn-helix transcriptional regulator n=1 Tax=Tolypothrix sp. NIES-4075 TaxID=2005459 RepID=UPI000B5C8794|nr:helix-turn-helix transcriptional regulator [Tolypothrix sp. NIES-4075]GAX46352.1 helix-turn-helix domain-containing protein [Tolypothrix sp. NIES-4075]
MNSKVERLAKLVKELRGSQSQHQFAKKIGVSRSSITFWESGQAWPDTENIEKLAALKGWSLSELQMYLVQGDSPSGELLYPVDQILVAIRRLPSDALAEVLNVGLETLVSRTSATQSSLD